MLSGYINGPCTGQSLTDALHGIDCIVNYIKGENSNDILADAVWYESVISSICLSWHRRWMTNAKIETLGQDEFELLCRSIPKWDEHFEIVPLVPSGQRGQKHDQERMDKAATMLQHLGDAKAMAKRLVQQSINGGPIKGFDTENTPIYRNIVAELCTAWYCKHDGHEGYSATRRKQAPIILIPDWGLVNPLRLVDVGWFLGQIPK
jgi:hypothetical protein